MNAKLRSMLLPLAELASSRGFDVDNRWGWFTDALRRWHRPFDQLPLRGVGAEIGVYRGMHARQMLKLHPAITELWLVDAYTPYPVEGGLVPNLHKARATAHRVVRRFHSKVKWVEVSSPDCAGLLPQLDFCYIDGNHSYESVSQDLRALWGGVKPGGIFGGHDFVYTWPSVIQAVSEFALEKKQRLYVDTPDWWITKE